MIGQASLFLSDFCDMFVIAVGLSMAYILVDDHQKEKGDNKHFFFNFLRQLSDWCIGSSLARKKKPQQKDEENVARITVYYKLLLSGKRKNQKLKKGE